MNEGGQAMSAFDVLKGRVDIATWGIANISDLPMLDDVTAEGSRILIGYSKQSHSMGVLYNKVKEWESSGYWVRVLPSCHLKLWITSKAGYVGSQNLVQDTLVNYMHKVKRDTLKRVFDFYWRQAFSLKRQHTDLLRLPQAQSRYNERT